MKYEYFMNKNNEGFKKVTLTELKNELNKICVEVHVINDWIGIESTDLRKVNKVLRTIRKGTHYNFLHSDGTLCCYARKAVINNER